MQANIHDAVNPSEGHMGKLGQKILGTILAFASMSALAAPIPSTVGVGAATGTLDCAMTSDGKCIWKSSTASGYETVGSNTTTPISGASSASDVRGVAKAWGEANFDSYLPSLHAYASSNGAYVANFSALAGKAVGSGQPGIVYTGAGAGIADANVWAVQGYRYTGQTPFQLTVTGVLDSQFSSNGQQGSLGHSGFRLSIFDANAYVFDPGQNSLAYSPTFCPLMNNPSRFCSGAPQVFAHGSDSLFDTGTVSLTVGHFVNPGDEFFVGAFLDASVCCGLTADSSHTLNLAFNDFSMLESIPVPGVVPEPASVFVFMSGLALLGMRRRKAS